MFTILIRIIGAARKAAFLLLLLGLAACRPATLSLTTPTPTPTASVTPSPTQVEPTIAPATATPAPSPLPVTSTPTQMKITITCGEDHGQMEDFKIGNERLTEALTFRVYLPPCYDQETERRYPVLYLIHGQTYTEDQWDRIGADEAADNLISSGEVAPFIIVMPYDPAWTQPDVDPFGEALTEDLVPWIDAQYRTIPDREHRAIGGLSRGAAWAIHLGLTRWDLFSRVGAHSLALFVTDGAQIDQWIEAIPVESYPTIYLDSGRSDLEIQSTEDFEATLTKYRVPHEWHLFDGFHDEEYWSKHVEGYLRFYAAGWEDQG